MVPFTSAKLQSSKGRVLSAGLGKQSLLRNRRLHVAAASPATIDRSISIQLATAKLPKKASKDAFTSGMYQWATTMTVSGANMPFALPLQADRTPEGFDITFLRVVKGDISRIASMVCTVEDVQQDRVFFVRFKAGDCPFPDGRVPPGSDEQKLNAMLDAMPDVPLIMRTMSDAIKRVAAGSMEA